MSLLDSVPREQRMLAAFLAFLVAGATLLRQGANDAFAVGAIGVSLAIAADFLSLVVYEYTRGTWPVRLATGSVLGLAVYAANVTGDPTIGALVCLFGLLPARLFARSKEDAKAFWNAE